MSLSVAQLAKTHRDTGAGRAAAGPTLKMERRKPERACAFQFAEGPRDPGDRSGVQFEFDGRISTSPILLSPLSAIAIFPSGVFTM